MDRSRRELLLAASLLPVAGQALATEGSSPGLGVREAARRIRQGSLSAERYAADLIARQQREAGLGALINFDPARVLEQARAVDRRRRSGQTLGRLAGVPFVVKDQAEVEGWITTSGTPALRSYRSRRTSPVIAALLKDDAVLFSKANMHELAGGRTTTNAGFGTARNPYDRRRIPGGSSGGTAAAIAGRIVPFGIGEDTGGSIRSPSGYCGVAGLRPSTWPSKLYSTLGMVPPSNPEDPQTFGPMARTVSDLALVHEVISGRRVPVPASPRAIRIGVPRPGFLESPLADPGVTRTALETLARLKAAGFVLVELDYDALVKLGQRLQPVVPMGDRPLFARWLAENTPGLTLEGLVAQIASADVKRSWSQPSEGPDPAKAAERLRIRTEIEAERTRMFREAGVEAIAFPHPRIVAPLINEGGDPERPETPVINDQLSILAPRFGAPGLVVPAGMNGPMPVGLELDGLPGRDEVLIAIGMAVERALGPVPPPPERA